MTALYQIANDFAKLTDSDMPTEMIADTLDGIEWELEAKVEQILAVCKNELADAEALKEEARRLIDRAKASENRVVSLKEYVARSLETAGKKSMKAGLHQVTVRAPSKSVEITDVNAIPPDFVEYETTIKPDKLAIKHQIEAGIDIPGAQLKVGKPSLLIK
ncbi:siphovirus Gp157 family protein [Citrobacter portucalensis]|uniref:siphovirus Gp157 family protein n=1 Tax=Citrobacter portucalensis TaxID=1639133 RepID=UPI00226B1B20|nr:siphovirus Gp157 family protein [Citrobacter portucalensis]MCX8980829.1 siphovirus Gp157 family protein [Citrobacter portucalensis]